MKRVLEIARHKTDNHKESERRADELQRRQWENKQRLEILERRARLQR